MRTFKQFITETDHPMIDVDGVQKHRNNSEDKPIHSTDEGIRNFHRWFGDSDSVDHHGRPLVVHHSTPALDRGQDEDTKAPFNEFKHGDSGLVSFAKDKKFAEHYAHDKSHAEQSDKSPYTFSGYVKTKTFDPHNEDHVKAIKPHLGDEVQHQGKYGIGAFVSKKLKTDDFIEKLKGIDYDKHEKPDEVARQKDFEASPVGTRKQVHPWDSSSQTMLHKNDTHYWHTASDVSHPDVMNKALEAAKTEPENRHEVSLMHAPHPGRPWHIERAKATIYKTAYHQPAKKVGGNDTWEYTEGDHFLGAAKKAGFNAVKQSERKNENIGTFGTDQFKSTKNNGKFAHPTKIDE